MSAVNDEKKRRLAVQAEEQRAMEARTPDEVKSAAPPDDDLPATVAVSEMKMLNLPERYGIGSLSLYLRGIPSSRVSELVEAIFSAWPTALFVASKVPLTPDGSFDITTIAAYWTEILRSGARQKLAETHDENEKARQEAALETLVMTPREFVAQLIELEDAPPGEPSLLDEARPAMARACWLLAENCPQNASWTVEKLEAHFKEHFRLPDYARLARLLLEVNSIGGGYTDDLVERFTGLS